MLGALTVHGDSAIRHRCAQVAWAKGQQEGGKPQYAPDRRIDILNLKLDITPHFDRRSIDGKCTLTFKPIALPCREIRLDAIDLNVKEVRSCQSIEAYQVTSDQIVVTFENAIPADKKTTVTITYSAEPKKGLYFRTPEMGYKAGDTHLFTQGEAHRHRHWFPSQDYPNERFRSEVICRVPQGMTALSNGQLVSQKENEKTGRTVFHWKQSKPHVNYLISLVAGHFKKLEAEYNGIPLAFYTPPSDFEQAANSFQDTKKILAFFEEEIGVPYPWAKYYNVCVQDFMFGGMENTSITTLTTRTLHTKASEELRTTYPLDAHEVAHQWFGDLVTCKDWSHLWLNEGFATYYAALYEKHKNGREAMRYELYENARRVLRVEDDNIPIVYREYQKPMEQFTFRAYPKGGWVLHMLRSQLGPELYRKCIRTYLERHKFESVVTEDLNSVVEELSGRTWDRFFDQWVYHAGHPILDVSYSWDQQQKLAKLSIRQAQTIDEHTMRFHFPLTIEFETKGGRAREQVQIDEKAEDFYFPLEQAPKIVRVDPAYTLLAEIRFNKPKPLLYAQLKDSDDMMGRLRAVQQLKKKKSNRAIEALKETLNSDPFWGVRVEAAQALKTIHSPKALDALRASREQSDARAREAVAKAIGDFYHDDALEALRGMLRVETNPVIQGALITPVGAYPKDQVRKVILKYLNTSSYRNRLTEAAVEAIRNQADPSYLLPLREALKQRESEFTTGGIANTLETLAFLAQEKREKAPTRRFITDFVNDPRDRVRETAIAALGTLGDRKAIPLLETFTVAKEESAVRKKAKKAIDKIRQEEGTSAQLKELRDTVLDLQKTVEGLNDQVGQLKKQFRAKQQKDGESKSE